MTEKQARRQVLRWPEATRAGWLLACCAPDNISKGQELLDGMSYEESMIAICYRDHCLEVYAA